ncbi:MAG TPA: hypothetical protein VLJ76_04250 [Gaiellaceae bacterium]|nr:hypothetical protein [Gaiellaceae bacterium]
MELAARQGFSIHVVTLPAGQDPADLASGFEELLSGASHFYSHRVRLLCRDLDRQSALAAVQEFLGAYPDSPDRQDAQRLAADLLDLPADLQAGLAATTRAATGTVSLKFAFAADRQEQDALAACIAFPSLHQYLRELSSDDFSTEEHRRLRTVILGEEPLSDDLVALKAQLDARVDAEGLDEAAGMSALLRLRERRLKREIAQAGSGKLVNELRAVLEHVRQRISELGFPEAGAPGGG